MSRYYPFPLLRHTVQTGVLLLFLVLLFYVCSPYAGLVIEKEERPSPLQHESAATIDSTDNDDFDAEVSGEVLLPLPPTMTISGEQPSPKFPEHYSVSFQRKSAYLVPYFFLVLDPSVAIAVLASQPNRVFHHELFIYAGIVVLLSWIFARCFCGYFCPMGTVIDLTDWLLARIPFVNRWQKKYHPLPPADNTSIFGWNQLRWGILILLIVTALGGVLITGYVSPIPLLTRNLGFMFSPFQTVAYRGWHQVPQYHVTIWVSLVIFIGILLAGLFTPRFFCRFVCPSGTFFSLVNSMGTLFSQQINSKKCVKCKKCAKICHAGAISVETLTITPSRCMSCQSCVAACPTNAIHYGISWKNGDKSEKQSLAPLVGTRRLILQHGLMYGGIGVTLALIMLRSSRRDPQQTETLIRPPGSLPEKRFLQLCTRCGACFRVCPNDALQPCSLEYGLESLWTPRLNANWSGCEPSCNNCGAVCPSGAIQSLSLKKKRHQVMGVAFINQRTCLPYAGKEECRLCHDECQRAGYHAIEFMQVGTQMDENGLPIEESGFTAPVVLEAMCVGCGLCQARCHAINVKTKQLLCSSAVIIKQ